MDTNRILAELHAERNRIDQAISALEAIKPTGRRRAGRRPQPAITPGRRGRMSSAARRKLSRLLKQRWAQGKMKPKVKAKPAETSKPKRQMSAAGRKRISQAVRRRWAEWRRKQKTPTAKAA